ncbi:MAG: hypothetical protein M3O91_03210 [Chloroflexota bacterium]|nr:hypothetical protein [Chloroflexota bacterium]
MPHIITLTGEFILKEPKKGSIRYDDPREDAPLANGYVSKLALARAGVKGTPQRIRYTLEVQSDA